MHQPRNKSPRSLPVTRHNLAPKSTDDNSQHGFDSYILTIPAEALGHITAYLEPPALLALAQANRQLLDHVASDTVWLRAFLAFFLDIGPEIAVDSLLQGIPRLKLTWRDEYIARFKLVRCVVVNPAIAVRMRTDSNAQALAALPGSDSHACAPVGTDYDDSSYGRRRCPAFRVRSPRCHISKSYSHRQEVQGR